MRTCVGLRFGAPAIFLKQGRFTRQNKHENDLKFGYDTEEVGSSSSVSSTHTTRARSWIDTYLTVCMYVDVFGMRARSHGDVTVTLQ